MATYTKEEFVREVLVELGVVDATDAPEAEDAEHVSRRMVQKFDELNEDGVIPFQAGEPIPARYFLPLVSIVAIECMTSYGKRDMIGELAAKADAGMKRLWKIRQKDYFGDPSQATYF